MGFSASCVFQGHGVSPSGRVRSAAVAAAAVAVAAAAAAVAAAAAAAANFWQRFSVLFLSKLSILFLRFQKQR